jgi:subtilisin family serine protease
MTLPRSTKLGLAVTAAGVLVLAAGSPAMAAPAEGSIRDTGAAQVVAGSYIVVLKGGTDAARSARSLAGVHGGTVTHTYSHALRGFAVRASETAAKRYAADPAVEYVQRDGVFTISGTQPNPPSWGLDRIDQRNLPLDNSYTYPSTASAVTAYIIDTGIRFSHQTFGGRAVSGRDTVDNDNDASDCNGHGTHVAGTVGGSQYGVAKEVRLVGVRVLNCQGSGTTAGVAAGIDWVTAQHQPGQAAVANMSLGGGVDQTLDNAVANSIADGVTYAIAAGNGDQLGNPQNACNFSPARVPTAITVGATQSNDARASFSNFGTCLDIFAPGVGITSSWFSSDTATNTISGTSMATPHVTGAAALVLAANPGFSPQQVRDQLVANATDGKVTDPRAGSPNKLLFVGDGTQPPPPPPPPGCSATSTDTPKPIADLSTTTSTVTISGCDRVGSTTSTVEVHIRHTYRGDLRIDLVKGTTSFRLKNSNINDSAQNVDATYTVNLSGQQANGTWTLRVADVFGGDSGTLNSWKLTL